MDILKAIGRETITGPCTICFSKMSSICKICKDEVCDDCIDFTRTCKDCQKNRSLKLCSEEYFFNGIWWKKCNICYGSFAYILSNKQCYYCDCKYYNR